MLERKPAGDLHNNSFSSTPLALCYFVTFYVLGLVPAAMGPTLITLADQSGSQLHEISILFTMRSLGYLCSSILIGVVGVYNRWKGHPIMSITLALATLALISIPYIKTLALLSGVFLVHGVLSAFVDLGGNVLLIWAFHKNTGPYLNGLHFSFGLGAVTAPLLVAFALTTGSSPVYAYWMIALLSIPSIFWIYRMPSPKNPEPLVEEKQGSRRHAMPLWLLISFFFLYGGSEVSLGGWIHTYGIRHNLMPETTAAYLTSSFWGAFTFGRLLAIRLASQFAARQLIKTQLSGTVLFLLILLFGPTHEWITWGCTIMIGLCMSSIFPLSIIFIEKNTIGSGQLTSWFFVGASLGSMILPRAIGQYFESIGPSFFVMVILASLSLAILIMIYMTWKWNQNSNAIQ